MRAKQELDLVIAFKRLELSKMQHRVAHMRRTLLFKEYDPNQPRIPAKQTGGGRWTSAGRSTNSNMAYYDKLDELVRQTSLLRDECDEMHQRDLNVGRFVGISACYAQAYVRRAACERGHPTPPLNF